MLPPADRLEPVVTVNRMGVDERPHDIEARHALGADLNNLGVLYVLGGRLSEAWETFQEADVQFIEIANSFPYPPTPALLARAVTLYNRNVIDLIDGHFEADMIDAATKCLELVRPSDRDSGFGFVASAVGFDSYPDSIGD